MSKILDLMQFKKNVTIVMCLFFACTNFSIAQSSSSKINESVDSLAFIEQDSILKLQQLKDSLAFQFINIPKNNDKRPMLDSLIANITVTGNDFVSWVNFVNTELERKGLKTFLGQEKFSRPIWVIVVIGILFIALGLVRIFFYNIFRNIVVGFFNERVLAHISKEDNVVTSWPYILLYFIFSLSLGLFVVVFQSEFKDYSVLSFLNFIKTSLIVGVLFVAKILLIRIISVVFEIDRLVREYIAVLYLIYFNSMLILLPLLLLISFISVNYFDTFLKIYLIIVSILFIYRFLRTALTLLGNLKFSIFYLILYLCTLEIAPILILVKTLNK